MKSTCLFVCSFVAYFFSLSYIATVYNDVSVLENHHSALLFEILRNPSTNVFAGFPESDIKVGCFRARRNIRHLTYVELCTDIINTFDRSSESRSDILNNRLCGSRTTGRKALDDSTASSYQQ